MLYACSHFLSASGRKSRKSSFSISNSFILYKIKHIPGLLLYLAQQSRCSFSAVLSFWALCPQLFSALSSALVSNILLFVLYLIRIFFLFPYGLTLSHTAPLFLSHIPVLICILCSYNFPPMVSLSFYHRRGIFLLPVFNGLVQSQVVSYGQSPVLLASPKDIGTVWHSRRDVTCLPLTGRNH